jgi:hypothetical protein
MAEETPVLSAAWVEMRDREYQARLAAETADPFRKLPPAERVTGRGDHLFTGGRP